jgi:hypothetical protein
MVIIPRVVAALSLNFGVTFTPSWQQIGLVDSLAVPTTHAGRSVVLHHTAVYFQDHPEAELPSHDLTAAALTALDAAYREALTRVMQCATETALAREVFDEKRKDGQNALRGLIKELALAMSPGDSRWKGFGFNIPDSPSVPEAVTDLVVAPDVSGIITAQWEPGARAERYHVEVQAGEDPEFHRVVTVWDPQAWLTELTPGATVRVRVVAVNDGGNSVPSEAVEVTVPPLALARALARAA